MPIYEFKCGGGHVVEKQLPMSSDQREMECPECGTTAKRMISAPATRRTDSRKAALVEATQKTAYEPTVVNSVPRSGNKRATPVTTHPQHAKLPKP